MKIGGNIFIVSMFKNWLSAAKFKIIGTQKIPYFIGWSDGLFDKNAFGVI